jgi:hypothetical protein
VIVPTWALPFTIPLTVQLTPVAGRPALLIAAVRFRVLEVKIGVGPLARARVTETSLSIVSGAVAEDAAAVAPMVTAVDDGRMIGAVYRPVDEIVPTVPLPPATPLTVQEDTSSFAVSCTVLPRSTVFEDATRVSCVLSVPLPEDEECVLQPVSPGKTVEIKTKKAKTVPRYWSTRIFLCMSDLTGECDRGRCDHGGT